MRRQPGRRALERQARKWEADTFYQRVWDTGTEVKKGEYFGEFNLGSTIVIIFEAPEDFEFNFTSEGDTVRVGRSVMNVKEDICPAEEAKSN